jgi:hypothetical protein
MPKGRVRCAKSYGHRSVVMALLALGAVTVVTDALAQGVNTAPTEADVREAIGPVISLIVWPLFFVTRVVWFILEHTSAAILLSAVSAGIFAWRTMKTQSATVRLRETFATINRDNWDRDVIAARTTLMRIKSELVKNPGGISKFAHESNPIDAPDQRADPNTVRPPAQEGLNDVPAGPRDRDAESSIPVSATTSRTGAYPRGTTVRGRSSPISPPPGSRVRPSTPCCARTSMSITSDGTPCW